MTANWLSHGKLFFYFAWRLLMLPCEESIFRQYCGMSWEQSLMLYTDRILFDPKEEG